ncbi:hypothetical protein OH764_26075 [Burkholderia sp. M6-3]
MERYKDLLAQKEQLEKLIAEAHFGNRSERGAVESGVVSVLTADPFRASSDRMFQIR